MSIDPISAKQYREWMRGPAGVEGDSIVLDGKSAEKYLRDESEHGEQLLHDLVALSEPSPQDVLTFVGRHGLLWHGPKYVGDEECREFLTYWRAAAWDLRILIDLYIRLDDAEAMRGYLRALRDAGLFWAPIPDDDVQCLENASIEIARQVTEVLQGCSWTLTAACTLKRNGKKEGGPTEFRFGDDSPNLVKAAYAQFASMIVNKAPFYECEGCGRFFPVEHGNQRYCETSCSVRTRKARQRAKEA